MCRPFPPDFLEAFATKSFDIESVGVDGNEQVGFRPGSHLRALIQRNEDILISRHEDTIAACRFEFFRQHFAKLERHVFFRRIRAPSMRACVDPAMARIDNDERPPILCIF